LTPFEVYKNYCAIKAHFNSSFDFVKCGTGIKVSRENYENRTDKVFFERLSNKHLDYVVPYLVANFIDNPNAWIGELQLNIETQEIYFEWKKRVGQLFKTAEKELTHLKIFLEENGRSFDDLFSIKDGNPPMLYRLTAQKYLTLETYLVFNEVLDCHAYFRKVVVDDPVFDMFDRKIVNYRPFLMLRKDKCKRLIQNIFLDKEAKTV